jgi:hypothetical protein
VGVSVGSGVSVGEEVGEGCEVAVEVGSGGAVGSAAPLAGAQADRINPEKTRKIKRRWSMSFSFWVLFGCF